MKIFKIFAIFFLDYKKLYEKTAKKSECFKERS